MQLDLVKVQQWVELINKTWMCYSWLHRLKLLRQVQENHGNSGH